MESGAPVVFEASRLRADEAAREVRRRGAGDWADPRISVGQHLGTGLVERVSARRAEERGPRVLARRHPQAAQDVAARHGSCRRALLLVTRIRTAPEDVLGAFALRAPEG